MKIDANQYYANFLNEVLNNRELWMLKNGGSIVAVEDEEHMYMPLWSTEAKAAEEINGEWNDARTERIFLCDFVELAERELIKDEIRIAFDLCEASCGLNISAEDLIKDIKEGADRLGFDWHEPLHEQKLIIEAYERTDYIIEKIIENGELWLLFEDECVMCIGDEAGEWIPVWASEAAAGKSDGKQPENCMAEAVSLGEFINEFAENPGAEQDGICICDSEGYMPVDFETFVEILKDKAAEMEISFDELLNQNVAQTRFIFNIVKNGEIWLLTEDGGIATVGSDIGESIPLFATREEAQAECIDEWGSCEVTALAMSEFIGELLVDMERDGMYAFLIVKSGSGNYLTADKLKEEILEEIHRQNPKSPLLRNNSPIRRITGEGSKKIFS